MLQTRSSGLPIYPKLRAFFVGGLFTLLGGCSSGEAGLILGRPQPQVTAGGAGSGGGGGLADPGAAGTLGSAAEAAGGSLAEAGAGGDSPSPPEPAWVQEKCTPSISFDNRDTTSQGQLFTDAVPSPAQALWSAAHAACRVLFREASEVEPVSNISLVVEDFNGVASTGLYSIRLSTRYLKRQADLGADLPQEIRGIFHFQTSLIYQSDDREGAPYWIIVGIADYVRLQAGYIARSERAAGDRYDNSGSRATAFFFDYLAASNPDIVYQLNLQLREAATPWSNDVFTTLMGSDIDSLWADYQATF